jgi:hypothetical protein
MQAENIQTLELLALTAESLIERDLIHCYTYMSHLQVEDLIRYPNTASVNVTQTHFMHTWFIMHTNKTPPSKRPTRTKETRYSSDVTHTHTYTPHTLTQIIMAVLIRLACYIHTNIHSLTHKNGKESHLDNHACMHCASPHHTTPRSFLNPVTHLTFVYPPVLYVHVRTDILVKNTGPPVS